MKKARIGITPYARNGNPDDQYLPQGYQDGIDQAGGEVVLIDFYTPLQDLPALVAGLDAMLFSGGPDVEPWRYGAAREPECGPSLELRDALELKLMDLVMARDIPVMGICRGIQLINVALGGTLVQDVPTRYGDLHQPPKDQEIWHKVTIQPGTRLRALMGSDSIMTNSYHHQCVLQPAPGLVVTAHSPNGVIEAVERPASKYLLAVQWHPEMSLRRDEISMRFFTELLAHC